MRARTRGVPKGAPTTLLVSLAVGDATAGDLNPPGPPTPTPLLIESRVPISSLPFTISQPGSHFLTRSLTGTQGILVEASHVTLDLNGFTLSGGGIGSSTAVQASHLRNGVISDWSGTSVYVPGSYDSVVEDLRIVNGVVVDDGGAWGISVGDGSSVVDCNVRGCGSTTGGFGGISTSHSCAVRDCTIELNRGTGLRTGEGGTISGTVVSDTLSSDMGDGAGDRRADGGPWQDVRAGDLRGCGPARRAARRAPRPGSAG